MFHPSFYRQGPDESLYFIEALPTFREAWRRMFLVNQNAASPTSDPITWPIYSRSALTWSRLNKWCASNSPEIQATLQSGACAATFTELQAVINVGAPEEGEESTHVSEIPLPPDLRALYSIHNGQNIDYDESIDNNEGHTEENMAGI